MTRSKEDKAAFVAHLRAAAKELGATNPTIPSNLLDSFSPSNALMILFQKPHATQCAGFHAWREAGRAVRKGAKGAAILVPMGADEDDNPRFSWRYVFDITDTDPISESSATRLKDLIPA